MPSYFFIKIFCLRGVFNLNKTNVMRILDFENISYDIIQYDYDDEHLGGEYVAKQINMPEEQLFKTLVTRGDKNGINVFCIPCNQELDLKKAAAASKNKSVEMLHVKELFPLTGYIRGGCSPIGMKKKYPTYIDETSILFEKIAVSAGVRGKQIIINPQTLIDFINAKEIDLTK